MHQASRSTLPTSDHAPWLDWLRFGAALAVLMCHARGGNWMDWGSLDEASQNIAVAAFFSLTRPNLEPVVVFFVLSGFLVGGRVVERLMNGTFSPSSFALDRFSRIYIPLVPALGVSALVAYIMGAPISATEFVGNLLSLQNILCDSFAGNTPLWSLSYEVWFYVLAGTAAAVAVARSRRRVLAMFLFAGAVWVYTALDAMLLYCWLLGAVAYPLRKVPLPWMAIAAGLLMTVGGASASQLSMQTQAGGIPPQWLPSRNVAILVMSAGFAITVAWLARFPAETVLMKNFAAVGAALAAFSYTLYLTHYPLLKLWSLADATRYTSVNTFTIGFFLLKIASCLLAAWLLYLPFERRTGDFRRWFRERFMSTHREVGSNP